MRKFLRGAGALLVGIATLSPAGASSTPRAGAPAPGPGLWETRPQPSFPRAEGSFVRSGNKFYLAGGTPWCERLAEACPLPPTDNPSVQESYDPVTRTWRRVRPLPSKWGVDHMQAVTIGGLIYYFAGMPSGHRGSVYIYNPTTDTFTSGTTEPRKRGAGGIATYQGKIYVAGGRVHQKAQTWFDVYDPVAKTWTPLPDMPHARDHFQAVIVGRKLYAIGGRDFLRSNLIPETDAYDFTTGRWEKGLTPMPTPRGGYAAALHGTEIIVFGGEVDYTNSDCEPGDNSGCALRTVEAYDTVTNTWRRMAPMPVGLHGIEAVKCNGGIYIATGPKTRGDRVNTKVHQVFFPDGTARPCPGP